MRPQTQPLDPDSDAGRAAAEALTAAIAWVQTRIANRRRQAQQPTPPIRKAA